MVPSERQLGLTTATVAAGGLAFLAWRGAAAAGSPLGVFVAAATVAAVVLDLIWASVVTRQTHLAARFHVGEVVTGDRVNSTVSVRGGRGCTLVFGPGETMWVTDPGDHPLTGWAPRRCVLTALWVEITSEGLCGLARFTRRRSVTPARPLFVGPRPLEPQTALPDLAGSWGDATPGPTSAGDVVRGVRAYVPGDPLRRVHWAASARTGELVVKEVDEPLAPLLTLVLDLGAGGEAGENAASRAAWYIGEAGRRGYRVVLSTAEPGGPMIGPVDSHSAAIRRLAAAVARRLPAPVPPPVPGERRGVVLNVTDEGDSWL